LCLVFPHEDVSQNTALAQFTSENLSNQLYVFLLEKMSFHKNLSVNVSRVHSDIFRDWTEVLFFFIIYFNCKWILNPVAVWYYNKTQHTNNTQHTK
jgi:hypothetical protein